MNDVNEPGVPSVRFSVGGVVPSTGAVGAFTE